MPESHGGKGGRKIGRDAAKCKRYREIMKREKNKARRLLSHLRRHPSDQCALDMLETLVTFLTPGGRERLRVFVGTRDEKIRGLALKREKAMERK